MTQLQDMVVYVPAAAGFGVQEEEEELLTGPQVG